MNTAGARICKDCGEPFNIKEKKLLKAEFVEVKSTRGGSVAFSVKTATKEELEKYAESKGYKKNWAHVQLALREKALT
jgi:hypothetical protein